MMTWTERIGAQTLYVDRTAGYCRVTFGDGSYTEARPRTDDPQWRERAGWMGYPMTPEGLRDCAVDHDLAHARVAVLLGLPESPVLRAVARGTLDRLGSDAAGWEEELILSVQLYLNKGEKTGPLRVFAWRGYDLPALRTALLHAMRRGVTRKEAEKWAAEINREARG